MPCNPVLNRGLFCLLLAFSQAADSQESLTVPALDEQQLSWLGQQIYRNECASQSACLVSWNEGEDFPSLGIGHFIWYRNGQTEPFSETFPALLAFMQLNGATLPSWLQASTDQPWPDRASFLADSESTRQQQLRSWLATTAALQTAFIVERFSVLATQGNNALADPELFAKLQAIANAQIPYGLYALIDYVHFKGEGTNEAERYGGQGWGLVQVLEQMPAASNRPLQDFVASAETVLQRRVANAPASRNEQRWLAGWQHRVQTYLPAPKP